MIGICTDSGAQLPPHLVERYGMEVVPLTVTIDGVDYLEHVELDADAFYARFADGRRPQVATAAPSPGRFAAAYRALVERGAGEILSVHVGAELSGTLNAAHVAATSAPVPVRLVDTGSASFVVAAATWAAAEAAAAGATLDTAAVAAETTAHRCGNVFVVNTLELARAGGRLVTANDDSHGVPVLRFAEGRLDTLGHAGSAGDAAELMAIEVCGAGRRLRVGVGASDESSRPVADALAGRLAAAENVDELVRYRVGPSVGAHTGPGTAGAVYWPS